MRKKLTIKLLTEFYLIAQMILMFILKIDKCFGFIAREILIQLVIYNNIRTIKY